MEQMMSTQEIAEIRRAVGLAIDELDRAWWDEAQYLPRGAAESELSVLSYLEASLARMRGLLRELARLDVEAYIVERGHGNLLPQWREHLAAGGSRPHPYAGGI